MDWVDEIAKFISQAEIKDVAKKLGISEEASEAVLRYIEEGLEDEFEEGSSEEEE